MELNGSRVDSEEYVRKLDKCLLLILNDQPDHRDDTIIAKLLDSLQFLIDQETNRSTLLNHMRQFVDENFLGCDLDSKDYEVAKFVIDFIALTIKIAPTDTSYLHRIMTFLDAFTSLHQDRIADINPPVLVSIIKLLTRLDNVTCQVSKDQSLLQQYQSQLNQRFLASRANFLDFDSSSPKSIYLRREFKNFYLKRLEKDSWGTPMDEISASNLDIACEIIRAELESKRQVEPSLESNDDVSSQLKRLTEKFSQKQMHFLINCEVALKNETQIEAFAWMSGYSILLAFMSPCEMDQFHNQKEALLNEKFTKTLNKICNHLATTPSQDHDHPAKELTRRLRYRLNLMFKLTLAFCSFLNSDNMSSIPVPAHVTSWLGFDFRPTREALKCKLAQYLVSPLYVKLNYSSSRQPPLDENFLLLLNELPFEARKLALATCALYLRQFVRNFKPLAVKMLDFVEPSQIIYLLKHVELENETKAEVLNVFSDVLATLPALNSTQADFFSTLFTFIETYLVLDEQKLTSAMLNFISSALNGQMAVVSIESLVHRLVTAFKSDRSVTELNCMQLGVSGERTETTMERSLLPRLCQLIEFMCNLLEKNANSVKFELVRQLLGRDDNRILKLALNFLFVQDDDVVIDEPVNELRQSTYGLLNGLFRFATGRHFELAPLTESTIQMIEKKSQQETEAFVRREMVSFLSSYNLSRSRQDGDRHQAAVLFTSLNFFAHTLVQDLDWQVQLNCLGHLSQVIRLVASDLDKYSSRPTESQRDDDSAGFVDVSSKFNRQLETANPIELVFVHSDCLRALIDVSEPDSCHDRCVVSAAAEILLGLKQNELLTSALAARGENGLDAVRIEYLEGILNEARLSADLYSRRPLSILDDILCSYQFDLDDEKAADCY